MATCQFDVCGDVDENLRAILEQIQFAKEHRADIVHFPECSLTGYGGWDIPKITRSDYTAIQEALAQIQSHADSLGINVIVGSHHYDQEEGKPKNCIYLINKKGEVETRYDKRILTGTDGTMDHLHYSHGNSPIVFNLSGIKCGMLICHEWRYPELYREYKKLSVDLLFQSWYDGGLDHEQYLTEGKIAGELILGATRGNAANNYFWISGSNTSKKESCFASFVIQPDGGIFKELTRNKPGVLISEIDFEEKFEDPSFYGRMRFL